MKMYFMKNSIGHLNFKMVSSDNNCNTSSDNKLHEAAKMPLKKKIEVIEEVSLSLVSEISISTLTVERQKSLQSLKINGPHYTNYIINA